jgi:hypothetical protein
MRTANAFAISCHHIAQKFVTQTLWDQAIR